MATLFFLKAYLGKAILRSLLLVISLLSSQLVFADASCFARDGVSPDQIAERENGPPTTLTARPSLTSLATSREGNRLGRHQ